jgi:hypothetical protein
MVWLLIDVVIVIYEGFKLIVREWGESAGLLAVAAMREGQVIDISEELTLNGARLSLDLRLPMANALILACVRAHKAVLWTQDNHFENYQGISQNCTDLLLSALPPPAQPLPRQHLEAEFVEVL